jgi:hypothetical protein
MEYKKIRFAWQTGFSKWENFYSLFPKITTKAYITPGNQNNKVNKRDIQNFEFNFPW